MMDPATLRVMSAALAGVAEEMGAALIRAAHSANIKERRDCSTAVFDARGRMVAQAEHIPVHLGAMPDAVAACRALDPQPGELIIVNDPYTGGTHLPDITLVSRVGDLGFVVSRAHHADVGGMQPASMPVGARELIQEGVVIPPVRLTDDLLRVLVANMRRPEQRLADLRAQVACQELGAVRLRRARPSSRPATPLRAAWTSCTHIPSAGCGAALARLPDGRGSASGVIEGDGITRADITIRADRRDPRRPGVGGLRRHRRPAGRECELPDHRDPLGGVLRGAGGV